MDDESLARGVDREIARLATRQHGVVTRQQLLALGLGRGAVAGRVERGRLHVVHAGVYLVGHTARPPHALEMAAVLACGQWAFVSHRSAARMWELIDGPGPRQVEVTVVRVWRPDQPKLRVYGTSSLLPPDIRRVEGISATSPARTLLDLGRFWSVERLETAVADALRRGLIRRSQLADQLARNRGRRGVAALRAVLDLDREPALTRSEAEARLLSLIRRAAMPSPELNARLGHYEVDFLWRRQRLVVEVDGFAFHGDRLAFERDRLRDADLQVAGFRLIRVTWRQLTAQPQAVIERISRALARAGDRASL